MPMFKGFGTAIGPRYGTWQNSWASSSPSTQLVDIETNSPAYDNLIF